MAVSRIEKTMGMKKESERKSLRGMGRKKSPQREESAWRKRLEHVKQGRGGEGGEGTLKWGGPPTFIFSIPRNSNFWDKGSKIKTSSIKRLLNQLAQPRIRALLRSSPSCWGWQARLWEHMVSVSLLRSDWSIRGREEVSLENFILVSTFWVRHTRTCTIFCDLRPLDSPQNSIWNLIAKGEELFSVRKVKNLWKLGICSWAPFK